jgi:hypothetical protein
MADTQTSSPAVYRAIAEVMADLSKIGIGKESRNQQQGYQFRGIDAVLNALSPLLAKHGLVVLPRMTERTVTERHTAKGGVLFYVVVAAEFDFIAAEDGSVHTARMYGEAMDSGDKATNKAMSAAYKYAAFQTFCIPTEAEDADAVTHDVIAEPRSQAKPEQPEGYADWLDDMRTVADEGTAALERAWKQSDPDYRKFARAHDAVKWAAIKTAAGTVSEAVPA